jgi:hypothetical protein
MLCPYCEGPEHTFRPDPDVPTYCMCGCHRSHSVHPAEQFECPRCHWISFNLNDVREGYCGHCHDWTREKEKP